MSIDYDVPTTVYTLGSSLAIPKRCLSKSAQNLFDVVRKNNWDKNPFLRIMVLYAEPEKGFLGSKMPDGRPLPCDAVLDILAHEHVIVVDTRFTTAKSSVDLPTLAKAYPHWVSYNHMHSKYIPTFTNMDITVLNDIHSIDLDFTIARKSFRRIKIPGVGIAERVPKPEPKRAKRKIKTR